MTPREGRLHLDRLAVHMAEVPAQRPLPRRPSLRVRTWRVIVELVAMAAALSLIPVGTLLAIKLLARVW